MKLKAGNKIVTKRQNNSRLWAFVGAKVTNNRQSAKGNGQNLYSSTLCRLFVGVGAVYSSPLFCLPL